MEGEMTIGHLAGVFLRRWKLITACVLVLALLLGAYRLLTLPDTAEEPDMEAYETALARYNASKGALEDSLSVLGDKYSSAALYNSGSILMSIDPFDHCEYRVTCVVELPVPSAAQAGAEEGVQPDPELVTRILGMYAIRAQRLGGAEAFAVTDYAGEEEKYLNELMDTSVMSTGLMRISMTVSGPADAEIARAAAMHMGEELSRFTPEIKGLLGEHTFTVVDDGFYRYADISLYNTQNAYLQIPIKIEASAESVRDEIDALTAPKAPKVNDPVDTARSVVKYVAAGAVGGLALGCVWAFLIALYGNRNSTVQGIAGRFGLRCLGVLKKDEKRRRGLAAVADRLTGEPEVVGGAQAAALLKAGIDGCLTADSRLLLTGTPDEQILKQAAAALSEALGGRRVDCGGNIAICADTAHRLADADAVIIAEQLDASRMSAVKTQLKLLDESGRRPVGYIII